MASRGGPHVKQRGNHMLSSGGPHEWRFGFLGVGRRTFSLTMKDRPASVCTARLASALPPCPKAIVPSTVRSNVRSNARSNARANVPIEWQWKKMRAVNFDAASSNRSKKRTLRRVKKRGDARNLHLHFEVVRVVAECGHHGVEAFSLEDPPGPGNNNTR